MTKIIDEKNLTIDSTRNTQVFYIKSTFDKIEKTNLLNHIMRSARFNTKNSNKYRYHICINGNYIRNTFEVDFGYIGTIKSITVSEMNKKGDSKTLHKFGTLEQANNELLKYIYTNEYLKNTSEKSYYYNTLEEAENKIEVYFAKKYNISLEVSKSILRKQRILSEIRSEGEINKVKIMRQRINRNVHSSDLFVNKE